MSVPRETISATIKGRINRRGKLVTAEGTEVAVTFGHPYTIYSTGITITPVRATIGRATYSGLFLDHQAPVRLRVDRHHQPRHRGAAAGS